MFCGWGVFFLSLSLSLCLCVCVCVCVCVYIMYMRPHTHIHIHTHKTQGQCGTGSIKSSKGSEGRCAPLCLCYTFTIIPVLHRYMCVFLYTCVYFCTHVCIPVYIDMPSCTHHYNSSQPHTLPYTIYATYTTCTYPVTTCTYPVTTCTPPPPPTHRAHNQPSTSIPPQTLSESCMWC